jgi:peptide/nickel transport system permease protein
VSRRDSFERSLMRDLRARSGFRVGIALLAVVLLVAAAADFLASDMPVAARIDGHLYLFPNLSRPVELRAHTVQSLLHTMGDEDWLVAPWIPWGVNEQDKGSPPLEPPSGRHWLGTDTARRDVLARMIHGARISLWVGVVSVSIFVSLGTLLGLLAGFFGGWMDAIVSRLIETVMSVPVFFLILAVMGVLEGAGTGTLMAVIALVYWTRVARLVRAETLRLRQLELVDAALALGLPIHRILLRHVLPHCLGPILVAATFGMAASILVEAALSFLGFGTPDNTASWGGLLRGAMGNFHAWWLVLFPGAAVFATVTASNLVGDALRDTLDPRLRTVRDRDVVNPQGA